MGKHSWEHNKLTEYIVCRCRRRIPVIVVVMMVRERELTIDSMPGMCVVSNESVELETQPQNIKIRGRENMGETVKLSKRVRTEMIK